MKPNAIFSESEIRQIEKKHGLKIADIKTREPKKLTAEELEKCLCQAFYACWHHEKYIDDVSWYKNAGTAYKQLLELIHPDGY